MRIPSQFKLSFIYAISSPMSDEWKNKPESYWKENLSREEFKVCRKEGTERAFTGDYWELKDKGVYLCKGCGLELFSSDTKYDSGTGWPSFHSPVTNENVGSKEDRSLFRVRTEVHCNRCGCHLGHVFDDGPEPSGKRFCINSVSLKFKPER